MTDLHDETDRELLLLIERIALLDDMSDVHHFTFMTAADALWAILGRRAAARAKGQEVRDHVKYHRERPGLLGDQMERQAKAMRSLAEDVAKRGEMTP